MKRRSFLTGLGAAGVSLRGAQQVSDRPPNILLVVSDDLAAWMLSCYGNQHIRTPHLDRLASQGVRFRHCSVCTPVCSPSRATLQTGRVPRQHGIHDFLLRPHRQQEDAPTTEFFNDFFSKAELPDVQGQETPPSSFPEEIFLSDLLTERGYYCGYAGKWHLGDDHRPQHGNKFWYTFHQQRYADPVMNFNGRVVEETGYAADLIHQRTLEFLKIAQERSDPWFLTVSHLNPHTPLDDHPPKYYEMYRDSRFETVPIEPVRPNALREASLMRDPIGNLRKTAAGTTALDDRVGDLIDYLEQTGLAANTLVFFVGDHGFLLGRHGYWSKGLASNPINMYEEVMNVPLIVRWPGRIPEGTVRHELVSLYDLVPTVLDLVGIEKPNRNLCGRSYWPLMRNREPVAWDNRVFGHFRNTTMIRTRTHKLVLRNDAQGPNELWDLVHDPLERTNHIDDSAYHSLQFQLTHELNTWLNRYSA